MDRKEKVLNLIDLRNWNENHDFRIESTKNTIDYVVGKYLSANEAQKLIDDGWTINISGAK